MMNDNEKYIEEFVRDIPFDAPDQKHRDALKQQLLNAMPRHRLQPTGHTVQVWRTIMNKPLIKVAAAAVIVVAALYALNIIGNQGVALAEVVERIKNIKTVAYRTTANVKGMPGVSAGQTARITTSVKLSYDRGVRIDAVVELPGKTIETQGYILFEKRVAFTLMPAQKKYIETTLTDEVMKKMETESGDPLTLLNAMVEHQYTELGYDTIDGTRVWGIEVADPSLGVKMGSWISEGMFDKVVVRLWVDVKTKLPVRLSAQGSSNNGDIFMDMVVDEFQWAVEIAPAELEPVIPDDYELLGQARWDVGNEGADIVEVLRLFAQYAHGKYPSSLTTMTVARELTEALKQAFAGKPSSGGPPKELIGTLVKVDRIGMMYATLAREGKNPAYYGNKVTAEFPHAVLLRWKISDNAYKVIFADLSSRDVTVDELAELEAAPLNPQSKAIKPQPANGLVGIQAEGLELRWLPGANVTEHKVFLGASPGALTLLAQVKDSTSVQIPALERGATYYWRVDEVQPDGSEVTGDVWSFNPGGLVGWWKLDDASGGMARDSSGNNLHGTIAGNPAWVDGKTGKALLFDGDGDYVNAGNDSRFDITNQITIAAWINVNRFDRDWQTVVAKGDGSWRLQRNQGRDSIEFACTGVAVPGALVGSLFGAVGVNDGRWHHVAGTFDGSKICLYVDGRLDVAAEAAGSIKVNGYNVLIGANAEKPDRCWNGLIDDVRIYNYALSPSEVMTLSGVQ